MDSFRVVFIAVYILQFAFFVGLELLNLAHLRRVGAEVPGLFRGFIDEPRYGKIAEYTRSRAIPGLAHEMLEQASLFFMMISGFLVSLDGALASSIHNAALRGLFFILTPALLLHVLGLPFGYVQTFVIEENYGFNRTTRPRWVMDQLKMGVLSLMILSLLLLPILWLIQAFPAYWWLCGFVAVSLVQILIAVLYPRCIAPLFNRFEPIREGPLADKIRNLMQRNSIRVKRILEMNAGIRSRHTNAYFTGMGKTKQIVLYDTLLEAHPQEEVLAVLAHEVGHFKGKHVLKQLIISEVGLFVGFLLTGLLLQWPALYLDFGFDPSRHHAGFFILAVFWQKAGAFFLPFFMGLSRRFEREADVFAARMMGTARPLITAFKRMAAHNLSNLSPHPLYVIFHYSHPPLAERITLLENSFGKDDYSESAENVSLP
jgi:STE24 endopeptidase